MSTMISLEKYPLPPKVPLSLPQRLNAIRHYHRGMETIRDAGGPVTRVDLGPRWMVPRIVVTTSPSGARDVLTHSDGTFDKDRSVAFSQHRYAWGEDLFNLPHRRWLPRRRALQPLFTRQRVNTYAGHMADAATEFATGYADGSVVDLNAEVRRLTLRVLGRSVLGIDLGARAEELGPPVEHGLRWVTKRATRPVRMPRWLPTPARFRLNRSMATIHAIIDEAVAGFRANPDNDAPLIRQLLDTVDPATGAHLSVDAVRSELAIFIAAGHDTTATTLTYALWQLGRSPDIQERVATEVAALGTRTLTVDDVAHIPYTVAVLHEALRLCPPAPMLNRTAMTDTVVDGYRVEAGTSVLVGIYAMHRDPALWADPTRFDPGRFGPDQPKPARWQYLPFGGGQRSCVGDHFAMLEATLGLATIIRTCEITACDDNFPLALPFTMTAAGPIWARVQRRGHRCG